MTDSTTGERDRTMAEQRETIAAIIDQTPFIGVYDLPLRKQDALERADKVLAALRPPTPDQSIGEQQILDEANRRYVTDSYRCAFIEGAGWGLHNRAAADQNRAGEPVAWRKVLSEIKKIALTVKPDAIRDGLAHIVRLCIDAGSANDEKKILEDNIATVAFHLGQPGARLSVQHDKSGLIVDPGYTLKEISRRLEPPPPIPDGRIAREALKDAISQLLPFAEDGDQPAISACIDKCRAAIRVLALPDQRGTEYAEDAEAKGWCRPLYWQPLPLPPERVSKEGGSMTKEQCEAINLRST